MNDSDTSAVAHDGAKPAHWTPKAVTVTAMRFLPDGTNWIECCQFCGWAVDDEEELDPDYDCVADDGMPPFLDLPNGDAWDRGEWVIQSDPDWPRFSDDEFRATHLPDAD